jgi:hypothetical protein
MNPEKESALGYFMDLFVQFVTRPAEGLRRIRERPSLLASIVALLLTGIADALSFSLVDVAALLQSAGFTGQVVEAATQASQTPGMFWAFISEPFFVVVFSVVIIDGAAQLLWKKTAAPQLLTGLSFVGLIASLLRVVGLAASRGGTFAVLDVAGYASLLYAAIVGTIAVRLLYDKHPLKALLIYLLPLVLGLIVLVLLAVSLGSAA